MQGHRTEHSVRGVAGQALSMFSVVFLLLCPSRAATADPEPQVPDEAAQRVSDRHMAAARAAIEDGFHAIAEKELRQYLELKRNDPRSSREAIGLLVQTMHDQGNFAAILDIVDNDTGLAAGLPGGADFLYWRAIANHGLGKDQEALAAVETLKREYPGSEFLPRAERLRAWCLIKTGKEADAMAVFEAFLAGPKESPVRAQALLEFAQMLISKGENERATEVLRTLSGTGSGTKPAYEAELLLGRTLAGEQKWDLALNILLSLASNTSASPELRTRSWYLVGDIHEMRGEIGESIEATTRGLDLAPDRNLKLEGEFGLNSRRLKTDKHVEAVTTLKKLISQATEHPAAQSAQLDLADDFLHRKEYETAEKEFLVYLETFTNRPGTAHAYMGRGWALSGLNRHSEAALAFGKAYSLSQQPSDRAECLFKTADAHFADGKFQLSHDTYAHLLSEYPDSELVSKALLQMGETLVKRGKPREAEQVFARVQREHGGTPEGEYALLRAGDMHLLIARSMQKEGLGTEAVQEFSNSAAAYEKLITSYTNGTRLADAHFGRGLARYYLYEPNMALQDFEYVVSRFEREQAYEQAFYMRGMCNYMMLKDDKAVAIWDEFIRKYPQSQWASKVLFMKAMFAFNHGDYSPAEQDFLSFVEKYGDSDMADDALLWAAQSAMKQANYARAEEILNKAEKGYVSSDKMPEIRFAHANCLSMNAQFAQAILMFDEIINKYRESDLVGQAWLKKAECHLALGKDEPKRYEDAIKACEAVIVSAGASYDMKLEAQYTIGRCLEKQGKDDAALDQYYTNVMVPFLDDAAKGKWQDERAKTWFWRASRNAADILERRNELRKTVRILERVVGSGVPGSKEAQERIDKIKSENWWIMH